MTSNKQKLLFGIALGSLGVVCYNSYKHYKEKSEFIKKATSGYSTNYFTRTIEQIVDDSILNHID